MTLMILLLIGMAGVGFVFLPLWQGVRRPWSLHAPSGDEEVLYQEQTAAVAALRDLVMDFKLGNLAEPDYRALAAPLQQRAKRAIELQEVMQQELVVDTELHGGVATIDPELDARLEAQILAARRTLLTPESSLATGVRFCPQCGAPVSGGFRFCAGCGARLPVMSDEQEDFEKRLPPAENGNSADSRQPLAEVALSATKSVSQQAMHAAAPAKAASSTMAQAVPGRAIVRSSASKPAIPESSTSSPPVSAAPGAPRARRRWLWAVGSLMSVLWVTAVIWFYLDSRAAQENQMPVATLPNVRIQSLAVADGVLMMGEPKGMHTSQDGQEWTPLTVTSDIRAIAEVDSGDGAFWLAVGPEGLWRNEDRTLTWDLVESSPENLLYSTIAATPGPPGLIWATDGTSLYFSQDSGQRWTLVNSMLPGVPRALVVGATDLFIGTDEGVFRGVDGGDAWKTYNGSVNGKIISTDIQALAYDEKNGMLYAGTPQGISFQKLDSPGSWGERSLRADVTALALDGADNQVLWAGTSDGKIYQSMDRGVTWE